ncbi:VCBS repeat-containing protein [Streptomyces sp. RK62]|uniref:FG-GAP repeat domain-containing protein n=1 Tax=Streptomyces sp. RK62 TaxID=2824893 RepID=UPI001B38D054|nr:VCBS repeat-containing protein [Streptomyces sp. RK62]MBQ0997801.1 VCBS repeat-containing protein [Streptomyces sp. RK62]
MTRRARITTTLACLAALGAGTLTTAGTATADTTPTPIRTDGVWGIDYAGGFLTTVENTPSGSQWVIGRDISADGSTVLEQTSRGYADAYADGSRIQRVPCEAGPRGCVPMRSTGNGWVGYFLENAAGQQVAQLRLTENSLSGTDEPKVTGGRFVDATGRYYVYNASSTGKQYVDAVNAYRTHDVRRTRAVTAASVWGSILWTPGTGDGAVTGYDLEARKTVQTLATGAPCTVKELQVVGRWVYWNCGPTGAAGVYDRTAKKTVKVPSGPALVGDGYLVRHDRTAGKLMLTDFHTGTAAPERAVADLPAGTTADQRRLSWTVDKFGGDIAYVGQDKAIRIVPSDVPAQPLAKIESDVDSDVVDPSERAGVPYWDSFWQLNRPAHWTFTVKDDQGRVERTIKGSGASVEVEWDLRSDTGAFLSNGRKTWTLTATPEEGGAGYGTSGTLGYTGGLQGHHDQGGYRYGELVTLNSSGGLTLQYTEGKGTFDFKRSASGWPSGTVAVPFGDMGKDRCAEMLVRMPNGELRRYAGKCGASYTPSSSHTSLGTGWNAYDVLTAPGDLTGDGRVDLLARKASTKDVYVFANDGAGKLKAGVRIRSAWTGYTKIVGAGDLTGDGHGDVLARDKAGTLWRYDGLGDGRLKDRVKVFSDWGGSYNAIVGVGDITGDGRDDLVSRDTAGNLYRNTGDGKGSFGSRVKIASGWQGYQGLF